MSTTQPEEIKTLERTRQQLYQLSNSLGQLRFELELRGDSLPPWPSIQTSAALISHNLNALLDQLRSHPDFFASAHVYPSSAFPGRTQENLLTLLLRKRFDPAVEDWVKEGLEAGKAFGDAKSETQDSGKVHLNENELEQLWKWAGPAANNVAKEVLLSMDESSGEEGDESDDDNDDDGGNAGKPTRMEGIELHKGNDQAAQGVSLSLEELYKYMCIGYKPR